VISEGGGGAEGRKIYVGKIVEGWEEVVVIEVREG
jgi:hypothetical protein